MIPGSQISGYLKNGCWVSLEKNTKTCVAASLYATLMSWQILNIFKLETKISEHFATCLLFTSAPLELVKKAITMADTVSVMNAQICILLKCYRCNPRCHSSYVNIQFLRYSDTPDLD